MEQLRLRVQGDRVQTWLNGEAMADITDAKIGAAQDASPCNHDGGGIKVLWRNLRLTTPANPKQPEKNEFPQPSSKRWAA